MMNEEHDDTALLSDLQYFKILNILNTSICEVKQEQIFKWADEEEEVDDSNNRVRASQNRRKEERKAANPNRESLLNEDEEEKIGNIRSFDQLNIIRNENNKVSCPINKFKVHKQAHGSLDMNLLGQNLKDRNKRRKVVVRDSSQEGRNSYELVSVGSQDMSDTSSMCELAEQYMEIRKEVKTLKKKQKDSNRNLEEEVKQELRDEQEEEKKEDEEKEKVIEQL